MKFENVNIKAACEIMAWINDNGFPSNFYQDDISIETNQYSGSTYLTNSDYQTFIMNDGELEEWFFTPYEGHEGSAEDLRDYFESDYDDWHDEDIEYLVDMGIMTQEEVDEIIGGDEVENPRQFGPGMKQSDFVEEI